MTESAPSGEGVPAADARSGELGRTVAAQLARLDGLALDGHPDVYQEIHGGLRAALAEIDDA